MMTAPEKIVKAIDAYPAGFSMPEESIFTSKKGISEEVVRELSAHKKEPERMLEIRLNALKTFFAKPMPTFGADLSQIDFDNIYYYLKPVEQVSRTWDDVPESMKTTFDRLGIPEAEKKYLAGVGAQYDSEVIYQSLHESLKKQGVIFTDMDTALREYPEIVLQYFGTLIPSHDNKFAALNTSVWSGGSFVYIPKGVHVDLPLQAYFRINAKNMGQFERTLIIAEEGSYVRYIEGCTAPIYTSDSLHAAVVEIFVKPRARVRYTTIQNWSKDVYNLVTKRAQVEEEGTMEWIDGNLGAKVTMKYPSVYLIGRKAHGEVLSIALAGRHQHQDAGAKALHLAPETTSVITSKSISKDGGRTSYRGLIQMSPDAIGAKTTVKCDALLLDARSRTDTYPTMKIEAKDVTIGHEASVSKVGEEQLFYLMSRGLTADEAAGLIVSGFIEPIVKELPLEYAVELNKLIQLEMEGSVG